MRLGSIRRECHSSRLRWNAPCWYRGYWAVSDIVVALACDGRESIADPLMQTSRAFFVICIRDHVAGRTCRVLRSRGLLGSSGIRMHKTKHRRMHVHMKVHVHMNIYVYVSIEMFLPTWMKLLIQILMNVYGYLDASTYTPFCGLPVSMLFRPHSQSPQPHQRPLPI